jgi:hypothetical protein
MYEACVGGDPVFSESLCKELQKKFFQQLSIHHPFPPSCACGQTVLLQFGKLASGKNVFEPRSF